jgi:hypothetical protein
MIENRGFSGKDKRIRLVRLLAGRHNISGGLLNVRPERPGIS